MKKLETYQQEENFRTSLKDECEMKALTKKINEELKQLETSKKQMGE